MNRSLPTRGAWIEIERFKKCIKSTKSLPTRGAWIEIGTTSRTEASPACRSPHGERGLKYGKPQRQA